MAVNASARNRIWREGTPLATNLALLAFGGLMIYFARTGVGEFHHFVHGFSEDVFCQIMLYLGAISLVERCRTNRWTLRILLVVALLVRLVCVFSPAFLSTDVYRYVWDGKVQAEGINPYRYIPADPALAHLRDSEIYPNINRANYAHTIYPPGAQAIYLAVTRISATEPFMKLAMVGFEILTCLVLLRLLDALHLPRQRIVLYAWHPICFWEIASSGHVDAAALTFLALALYARLRLKPGTTGAWLGAAALVKLYPMALLPAFFYRSGRRMLFTLLGLVALGYACYASVGSAVFGFLPAYAQEEGIRTGDRYFLVALLRRTTRIQLPPAAYIALCAFALAALGIWCFRRSANPRRVIFSALVMATALTLCFSPHYPWYFLWLLPFLTLEPWRPAFYIVMAATYLLATQLGLPGEPMYRMNSLLYGGFALFLLHEIALSAWQRRANRHLETHRVAPDQIRSHQVGFQPGATTGAGPSISFESAAPLTGPLSSPARKS